MKRKKANFFLIVLIGLASATDYSIAQVKGGQHTKLFDLYALEKFEDCAFKAESMSLNEKYKKDPEPLLYLSMCMLNISKMDSSKLDQHYKEPLKEALKYAKKFRSKDKDGSMYIANFGFFEELKKSAIQYSNSLYNMNQYAKASQFLAMVNGFDEKDSNIRFMKGVCDILAKNAAEGAKSINDAVKGIAAARKDSVYKPDNISDPLLAEAFIIYSEYLYSNKLQDSAKSSITLAKNYFNENLDVRNQYNFIFGLEPETKPSEENNKEKIDPIETQYNFHQPKPEKDKAVTEEKQNPDSTKSPVKNEPENSTQPPAE